MSAAPFRDRVVHHALCAVIAPIFERGFIADSYANRNGYGTHRAVARYEHYRDRYRHVPVSYTHLDVYKRQVVSFGVQGRSPCPRIFLP